MVVDREKRRVNRNELLSIASNISMSRASVDSASGAQGVHYAFSQEQLVQEATTTLPLLQFVGSELLFPGAVDATRPPLRVN